jgi:hypothetical protein
MTGEEKDSRVTRRSSVGRWRASRSSASVGHVTYGYKEGLAESSTHCKPSSIRGSRGCSIRSFRYSTIRWRMSLTAACKCGGSKRSCFALMKSSNSMARIVWVAPLRFFRS